MATLEETLPRVRDRIARHRGSPIGEQNTKAALIEPLLRSLGWDAEDPDEVWREYKRRSADNPVDYALLILRTPRLFVEAKGLGENLDDHRWASQIMGYAVVAGVEWVVLTNGDEYRIYNSHAPVPVEEKLFRSVRISDEQARAEETLVLLSKERMKENWINVLWKAHFVDRQIRTAIETLFSATDPDSGLIRLLGRQVPTLSTSEIKAALARARIHLDFPVEPVPAVNTPPVRLLRPFQRPQLSPSDAHGPGDGTPWRNISAQDLIGAGLITPPLELEKTYLGRRFTARLETDGQVTYQGETYRSLSIAAGVARATVRPLPPGRTSLQTNGWTFWHFKDEDGRLQRLDVLRQRCFQRKALTGA